jgi:hypothetical protein
MTRKVIAVTAGVLVIVGLWWFVRGPSFDFLPLEAQQWRTVGSFFDRPPSWPGYAWERNGATVGTRELATAAGPQHCQMQSITMLTLGWPPGTRSHTAAEARQYIRDPRGALHLTDLRGTWMRNPPTPSDLTDSGYRYGVLKLFFAPSDQDRYVYLIAPADSERWPRSDPMTLCS